MKKAEALFGTLAQKQQELREKKREVLRLDRELNRERQVEAKVRQLEESDPEAASILKDARERAERAEQRAADLEVLARREIERSTRAERERDLMRAEFEEDMKAQADEREKEWADALNEFRSLNGQLLEEQIRRSELEDRLAAVADIEREAVDMRRNLAEMESKPFDPRERATFERLLYVLAREAGYKLEKPHADEALIRQYAASIGATAPTGKGSIARKLEAAVERYKQDCEN